jgi:nitrate/nitrite transporter NarK
VRTFWQFIVLRIGLGLGEGQHFAPRVKAINQWFPAAEKGRATSFFATLGAVAPAIVPVILTALYSLFLREKQVTVTLEPARAGAAPKRRDGEA